MNVNFEASDEINQYIRKILEIVQDLGQTGKNVSMDEVALKF